MIMKYILKTFIVVMFITSIKSYCQIGIGTKVVQDGVMLQLDANNKGLLLPRYALVSKSLTNPLPTTIPFGTVIFNTAVSGAFPNLVIPGIYWWNSDDKQWLNIADSFDTAVMKYVNNESSTNYNTTNWQNVRLFERMVFNESSAIYNVNSNENTVKIGRDGLYSISILLSFDRLSSDDPGRLSLSSRVYVNGQSVGTEQVINPGYTTSVNNDRGLFSHSFTEYLELKHGDVVSIRLRRTQGTYDGNHGSSRVRFLTSGDSSVSILRIR